MKKILLSLLFGLTIFQLNAQSTNPFTISGYIETYFGYDFNRPANNTRPGFIYSHNRVNEVNINLGYLKAAFNNEKVRSNLAIMTGTYGNANMAAEPGLIKNIYEANVGIKLSRNKNIWLDAGILPSHIGFESAVSKDCWTLTRGISSENSPFFEAGAKISFATDDGKFTAGLLYLNGWQRIHRPDGAKNAAAGLQLTYRPHASVTLNYSNYLGTEGPDVTGVNRVYHNIYVVAQITEKFGVTGGIDIGSQQKIKNNSAKVHMLAPAIIAQFKPNEKWAIASRFEYYRDMDGMLTGITGFNTKGYSLNLDYMPFKNAALRLEGKLYDSADAIFEKGSKFVRQNGLITTSLSISF